MKPVCLTCQKIMIKTRIGVGVLVLDSRGDSYQKYSGDEYVCPQCFHKIVADFGKAIQHFEEGFADFKTEVTIP